MLVSAKNEAGNDYNPGKHPLFGELRGEPALSGISNRNDGRALPLCTGLSAPKWSQIPGVVMRRKQSLLSSALSQPCFPALQWNTKAKKSA
jgi:hypothetical protein